MNIAIYCASNQPNNIKFNELTNELGTYLSSKNHNLVYGGSKTGLMGVIADAFISNNGKVIGVIPDVDLIKSRIHPKLTECIFTKDMPERRTKMIDLSDMFIALPGGPGTLDELSEILDLIRLKIINKPLLIYNMDGYYDDLETHINKYYQYGFIKENELSYLHFVNNLEDIKKYV